MDSSKSQRQAKHVQIAESIEHLEKAVDKIEELENDICGDMRDKPKNPTVMSTGSLMDVLNNSSDRIHELSSRIEGYCVTIKEKLF